MRNLVDVAWRCFVACAATRFFSSRLGANPSFHNYSYVRSQCYLRIDSGLNHQSVMLFLFCSITVWHGCDCLTPLDLPTPKQ